MTYVLDIYRHNINKSKILENFRKDQLHKNFNSKELLFCRGGLGRVLIYSKLLHSFKQKIYI